MKVIGSLDNAMRHGYNDKSSVYHLVFTKDSIFSIKIMDRSEELRKMDVDAEKTEMTPGSSSSALSGRMEMKITDKALEAGKKVEKDIDEFVESNPEDVETINCSRVSKVEFSRGTLFSLPYVRFLMENTQMKYDLTRGNFSKAGKLKHDVYESYSRTLKDVFGDKLRLLR